MKKNIQKIKSILTEMQKGENKEWLGDPVALIGVELHEIANNFDKMKEALEKFTILNPDHYKDIAGLINHAKQLLESIK